MADAITFAHLAALAGGTLRPGGDTHTEVRHLLTDSRQFTSPAGTVFFAIRGGQHDGHTYLPDLYARGVRLFVVEEPSKTQALPADAATLHVASSVRALQTVAAARRAAFAGPVVGITGSNGKTIVKEWLAQMLSPDYRLAKSPKSYNSQIGVPLSVWGLTPQHTLGLFEAGISRPGEMRHLAAVIRPTVGIFTNLGPAHDEGFADRAQKLAEKAQLFATATTLICCRDHAVVYDYLRQHFADRALIAWTRAELAEMALPFGDAAAIENAGHCVALMRWLGLDDGTIRARLRNLRNLPMRLERKRGAGQSILLDDSYSNDPAGLAVGLDFMRQQSLPPGFGRTIILSDLMETGRPAAELYPQIAQQLRQAGIGRLVGIGPHLKAYSSAFADLRTAFYPDTEAFLTQLDRQNFDREMILVKGARTFGFERITARLQAQVHGTRLEINLEALAHNLQFYRQQLAPGVRTMVMVKAFAYGSGNAEVASWLQFQGVDYLAVAYADEGVTLRTHGITLPIMVMNPEPSTFPLLLAHRLEPQLYSWEVLTAWGDFCAAAPSQALPAVHLKFDTGMRRLGFVPADAPRLGEMLAGMPWRVASLLTHLAAADEAPHDDFSRQQLAVFATVAQQLTDGLGYAPLRHALNSAGILRFPEAHLDMVRLGIGLYGVAPGGAAPGALRSISRLVSVVSQVKALPAGDTIGYGRHDAADHDRTIAVIAIGYADGFGRGLSRGRGEVRIRGHRVPVVGNVCMDMTMVDVTGLDVAAGDEVVIFDQDTPITELATRLGTIPYEVLTGIGERVRRVFYWE